MEIRRGGIGRLKVEGAGEGRKRIDLVDWIVCSEQG